MSTEVMKLALEAYELDQSTENHGKLMQAVHDCIIEAEKQEVVGFVMDRYGGANTPSLPPTPAVAWLNDNPKIGQILYATKRSDHNI